MARHTDRRLLSPSGYLQRTPGLFPSVPVAFGKGAGASVFDMRQLCKGPAVYYPGAGYDVGPFTLFVENSAIRRFVYVDYMLECDKLCDQLERIGRFTVIDRGHLSPAALGVTSWNACWHPDAPSQSPRVQSEWLLVIRADAPQDPSLVLYLGTEAIQTYGILKKLGAQLSVVVLQDHGLGCLWASFGATGPLVGIAEGCGAMPEMLYAAADIDVWPGYVRSTTFKLRPGGMHEFKRAIFRRG